MIYKRRNAMPSKPTQGESKDAFMGRCMAAQKNEKRPQDQKVAICFSMWREAHPKDKSAKKPEEK